MGVFEVVQAHHKPRGDRRPALAPAVVRPEMLVEAVPVDLSRQLHHGMAGVEQIRKSCPLHSHLPLVFAVRAGSWLHRLILQENRPESTCSLQYFDLESPRKRHSRPQRSILQDRL